MSYASIDSLQKALAKDIFHYAKDAKKASGRALGTLVEIITFHLIKSWGFEQSLSIERRIPEYGNRNLTHNVEFSLHPAVRRLQIPLDAVVLPIKSAALVRAFESEFGVVGKFTPHKSNAILSKNLVLRNSCSIGVSEGSHLIATLDDYAASQTLITVTEQLTKPYTILECKRVGIEEGMKKGPQTIEKAKQGAYVARSVSSLQKIRHSDGTQFGVIYDSHGTAHIKPYDQLKEEIIYSGTPNLLKDFVLTVGAISNHGNWFTSGNQNKEMQVLSQSYDWLIFLTDAGLAEFISNVLLEPTADLQCVRNGFLSTYTGGTKKTGSFTKISMLHDSDQALSKYFSNSQGKIERWFNVISPDNSSLQKTKRRTDASACKAVAGDTYDMTAGRTINTQSRDWGTPGKYVDAVRAFQRQYRT